MWRYVNKPFLVELEWCHVSSRLHIFFPALLIVSTSSPDLPSCSSPLWWHSCIQGHLLSLKQHVHVVVCISCCFAQRGIPDFCLFFLENRGRKKNAFLSSSRRTCLPRFDHSHIPLRFLRRLCTITEDVRRPNRNDSGPPSDWWS